MSMVPFKVVWHLNASIKKIVYKVCFGSRFFMGEGTTFRSSFHIYLEKDANIKVGNNCFFNNNCSINALEAVTIDDGCIFGENVKIYDHNHKYSVKEMNIKDQGYTISPVQIGKHCWFGSNVTVLQGTRIGDNCVIGANCLIYKDVPDNTVVICKNDYIERSI